MIKGNSVSNELEEPINAAIQTLQQADDALTKANQEIRSVTNTLSDALANSIGIYFPMLVLNDSHIQRQTVNANITTTNITINEFNST